MVTNLMTLQRSIAFMGEEIVGFLDQRKFNEAVKCFVLSVKWQELGESYVYILLGNKP